MSSATGELTSTDEGIAKAIILPKMVGRSGGGTAGAGQPSGRIRQSCRKLRDAGSDRLLVRVVVLVLLMLSIAAAQGVCVCAVVQADDPHTHNAAKHNKDTEPNNNGGYSYRAPPGIDFYEILPPKKVRDDPWWHLLNGGIGTDIWERGCTGNASCTDELEWRSNASIGLTREEVQRRVGKSTRYKALAGYNNMAGKSPMVDHAYADNDNAQRELLQQCHYIPSVFQPRQSCTVIMEKQTGLSDFQFDPPKIKVKVTNPNLSKWDGSVTITQGSNNLNSWDNTTSMSEMIAIPATQITFGGSQVATSSIKIKFLKEIQASNIVIGMDGGVPAGFFGLDGLYPDQNFIGTAELEGEPNNVGNKIYPGIAIKPESDVNEILICEGTELTINIAKLNAYADTAAKAFPVLARAAGIFSKASSHPDIDSSDRPCNNGRRTFRENRELAHPMTQSIGRVFTQLYAVEVYSMGAQVVFAFHGAELVDEEITCGGGVFTVSTPTYAVLDIDCPQGCVVQCEAHLMFQRRDAWTDHEVISDGGWVCTTVYRENIDPQPKFSGSYVTMGGSDQWRKCTQSTYTALLTTDLPSWSATDDFPTKLAPTGHDQATYE